MPDDLDDDLFEIDDPEVNVGDLMDQIRERIQERHRRYGNDIQAFPAFEAATYPGEPHEGEHDLVLHHDLRLLNEAFAARDTGGVLAPSPATRVPVLGRLWETVRGQAHSLVLFYVNRSVGQQVAVDRQIVSVLNQLTAQIESEQREIARLRQEIARLGTHDDV